MWFVILWGFGKEIRIYEECKDLIAFCLEHRVESLVSCSPDHLLLHEPGEGVIKALGNNFTHQIKPVLTHKSYNELQAKIVNLSAEVEVASILHGNISIDEELSKAAALLDIDIPLKVVKGLKSYSKFTQFDSKYKSPFYFICVQDRTFYFYSNENKMLEIGICGKGMIGSNCNDAFPVKDKPSNLPFRRMKVYAAGINHVLILDTAGRVHGCGNNDYSQISRSKCRFYSKLHQLSDHGCENVAIACHHNFSVICQKAVTSPNFVFLLLGSSYPELRRRRIKLPVLDDKLKQLKCGGAHVVVLLNSGKVFSFGSFSHGQTGSFLEARKVVHGQPGHISLIPSLVNNWISPIAKKRISSIETGANSTFLLTSCKQVYGLGHINGQIYLAPKLLFDSSCEMHVKQIRFAPGYKFSVAEMRKSLQKQGVQEILAAGDKWCMISRPQ